VCQLKQTNRFFAFGCSFTNYYWLTWADLLSDNFDHYENWGRSGGGNQFIFNSVMECDQRNQFTKDDTIIICWTSADREDRYTDEWLLPGNIYTQPFYDQSWVKKFVTEKGCLIRDLALIKAIKNFLDYKGCHYKFLSMVPINYNQYCQHTSDYTDVLDLYKDIVDNICPSFYEVVFKFDWYSRPQIKSPDFHPKPADHLEYIQSVIPEYPVSNRMRNLAQNETEKILSLENPVWEIQDQNLRPITIDNVHKRL